MAVTTGNDYDHIDIAHGDNATRHFLKDSKAREDLVVQQAAQPSSDVNKIWFPSTIVDEVAVPTEAEHEALAQEVNSLKSAVGDFVYKNKPIAGYKYIHMPVMDAISAGTTIFAKALNVTSDIESIWLTGKYNSSTQNLINLTDGQEHIYTAQLNFTEVKITVTLSGDNRTDGNTTYEAICITNAKNDTMTSMLLENQKDILSLNSRRDSPFETDINSKFKGIIGFQFIYNALDTGYDPKDNQQYRITNIYYKDSYYLYISMQRYKDGAWSAFDNLTITTANAPTETALMVLTSNYKRFRIAFIPGLMTAGRATSVEYMIKNTFVNPFVTDLQNQINEYVPFDSYMLKDVTRQIVTVKKDGTGDYTTIGAAYSAISSGKLSSFFNQYEIVVYPGTYNEKNLICPRYTHTHGLLPNTVVVTSEGMTGTEPVFDQMGGPSKLSNMEIRSQTGYCIHIDNPLIHAVVNENLHCKKIYPQPMPDFSWINYSGHRVIIGMGAQPQGMSVVFNGCWFEDGSVVCHSNSSSTENGNFHVVYNNCKLTNAFVQFNMAGNDGAATVGNWIGEINGLVAPKGYAGIVLKYGAAVTGLDYNFGWQIIGGGNDVAIKLDKASNTSAPDCWDQVNVTEKMIVQTKAAITKGQLVTDGLIPATAEEKKHNIIGIALDDAASGDDCPVWAGNAFVFSGTNGEYGVGADGALSASATEKIGKIINNVFYRY